MVTARSVRDIDYQLLPGSNRKTTDIVIERNGVVVVRSPLGFTPEQIDAVVESKRHWIYRNLAEWRDLNTTAVVREWVNGETFLYLGRSYRLSLVSGQEQNLLLKDGRFCLRRELIEEGGTAAAKKAFEAYYSEKGLHRIKERVNFFAPKVGVKITSIFVKDMAYHWASCDKFGKLKFNWKCMMAPPKIIDYVIVHELCHMHYQNHSDAFWNEVDKILPDYRERKEWLKFNGASLSI
ncbi:metal-dependent hydrolase [Cellvibrio mixtus]|uniref:Metal-dependent hydrolase n=1 Tax=Cellvibrio mixtus TaxID=39650 RepID=A0A266QDR3_9GAMM|nr:SprT family zinc-dependent metalloprotease [Cellvibrio mixtus]OZY87509.1 metal-dependent hydrolase [Cellvibrio mixtus]